MDLLKHVIGKAGTRIYHVPGGRYYAKTMLGVGFRPLPERSPN